MFGAIPHDGGCFFFVFLFFFPFLSLWYCSRVRWALFPFFLSFLSAASSLDVSHFLPSVAQTTWPSQQHIYRAPWWWWWCLAPSASSSSSIPVNCQRLEPVASQPSARFQVRFVGSPLIIQSWFWFAIAVSRQRLLRLCFFFCFKLSRIHDSISYRRLRVKGESENLIVQ